MEWTREKLYTPIEKAPEGFLKRLKKQVDACAWRQTYHIQPKTGLLNDPNGFAYYQGEYHLFYQWFPLGAVHGLKYWYHLKSKDLISWENLGIGIKPEHHYDSHGAYSGSAIEKDGKLYLMYTGNHRDADWNRRPTQVIAIMHPDGTIEKRSDAVIQTVPENYTDHFRDPKVWEKDGKFYAIIGAQRENEMGCAVLYQSSDLMDWDFLGELATNAPDFGYMWECPDYFELDGRGILMLSPQGLDQYPNIYQSGYFLGDMLNLPSLEWSHEEFLEIDNGFDFYAPQTMEDGRGRRIMIAWMGLPDIDYPTDESGWAHCMTLPRELKLIDGKLHQQPVPELEGLRESSETFQMSLSNQLRVLSNGSVYELECHFSQIEGTEIGLSLRKGGGEETVIKYDCATQRLIVDRSKSGKPVATEYGTTRVIPYAKTELSLRIFMDNSSMEVFLNGGEVAFTSRIFPTNNQNDIEIFANGRCQATVVKHELKKSGCAE
ncbi:MAG: sucrose-6-phosphate hydrolase [Turicibacter sp.]|nr:sucrose-6-phosphate hydrolase [Turicibacter sp.]